ncbi:COG5456 Predicted integral membrane protein linked to a cation pump [Sphingomonadaceae bacterium]
MIQMTPKPFTGYHMAAILIGFFGIVIAVNIYMAKQAIGSFGGTVVDNSYVASQQYNGWLEQADREAKLGWTATVAKFDDGRISVMVSDHGVPGKDFVVSAKAEHPLGRTPARNLQFQPDEIGRYVSLAPVPDGRWLLQVKISRDGNHYKMIADVQ